MPAAAPAPAAALTTAAPAVGSSSSSAALEGLSRLPHPSALHIGNLVPSLQAALAGLQAAAAAPAGGAGREAAAAASPLLRGLLVSLPGFCSVLWRLQGLGLLGWGCPRLARRLGPGYPLTASRVALGLPCWSCCIFAAPPNSRPLLTHPHHCSPLQSRAVAVIESPQAIDDALGVDAPLLVLECLSHLAAGSGSDGRRGTHAAGLWRRAHVVLGETADRAGERPGWVGICLGNGWGAGVVYGGCPRPALLLPRWSARLVGSSQVLCLWSGH